MGETGLKLKIDTGARGELEAISWSLGPRIDEFGMSRTMDIAYRLELNEFRGVSRLQARIADVRFEDA